MSEKLQMSGNNEPRATEWGSLGQQQNGVGANKGNQDTTPEQFLLEREHEVEYMLLTKDYNQLGRLTYGINFTPQHEQLFFNKFLGGEITGRDAVELLKNVNRPDQVPGDGGRSTTDTYGIIVSKPLENQIVFYANGNERDVNGGMAMFADQFENPAKRLIENYETVLNFAAQEDEILARMEADFSKHGEKMPEGVHQAFKGVCSDVYGFQAEYLDTLDRIAEKAERIYEAANSAK